MSRISCQTDKVGKKSVNIVERLAAEEAFPHELVETKTELGICGQQNRSQ